MYFKALPAQAESVCLLELNTERSGGNEENES